MTVLWWYDCPAEQNTSFTAFFPGLKKNWQLGKYTFPAAVFCSPSTETFFKWPGKKGGEAGEPSGGNSSRQVKTPPSPPFSAPDPKPCSPELPPPGTPGIPSKPQVRRLWSVQRRPMAPISRPPNPPELGTSEPQFFRNFRRRAYESF